MTQALRLAPPAALRFPAGARCIAYVRVSTERQAGETKVSPDTQLVRCTAMAAQRGCTVQHVVTDTESGAHLERLDRLIAACQAHRLPPGQRGLIVVYDTSRWGRFERPGVAQMFREQFHRIGWDVAIGDAPDTGNEAANLFVAAGQDIASSEYRKQLRQKVVDNMPKVAARGFWQGRAPFGYEIVDVLDGQRHRLVKGSARDVATVQRIFTRFTAGVTLQGLAAELNRDRVPGPFEQYPSQTWGWSKATAKHPHGRRPPCGKWTSSAVRSLLNNETYTGKVIFKPREVRDDRNQLVRFTRGNVPVAYWVIASEHQPWWHSKQLPHEPLIEARVFSAARQRMRDKAKPRHWSKPQSKQPFYLSGLVTCEACGGPVVGGGGSNYGRKDPHATRFYKCRNADGDHASCSRPMLTVNQRWLEREVVSRVSAHVCRLVETGKLARMLDQQVQADEGKTRQVTLGREIQQLEAQRRTLVEKIAKGLISDEDAADTMTGIKGRLVTVGRALEELKTRPSRSDRNAERDKVLQMAMEFPKVIQQVPAPVARELLSYWVEGITLNKKGRVGKIRLRQLPLSGFGSVDQDLPGAARPCSPAGSPPSSPE